LPASPNAVHAVVSSPGPSTAGRAAGGERDVEAAGAVLEQRSRFVGLVGWK